MNGLRNALLALGAGAVVQRGATFVVVLVLARVLGVERFGEFAVAQQLGMILALFADMGVRAVVARELATTDADPGAWIRAAIRTRLVTGALLLGAYIAALPLLPLDAGLAAVCAAVVLPMAFDLKGIADGVARTGAEVKLECAATGFWVLSAAALAGSGALTPTLAAVCFVSSRVFYAVLVTAWLPTAAPGSARPSWRQLVRSGGPVSLAQLALTVTQMADLVLIRVVLGAEAAGVYAAVDKLMQACGQPVVLLTRSLQPHLQRAVQADALPAALHRAVRAAGYLTLPIAAGGLVTADGLLLLLFGPDYAVAEGATLRWLLVGFVLLGVGGRYNDCLFAQRRVAAFAAPLLLGAVVNVAGTLALLRDYGVPGAAFATAASALVIAATSWLLVRRRGPAPLLRPLGPPLLVALGCASAAVAVPWSVGGWWQVAAGALAFGALVYWFEGAPWARANAVEAPVRAHR